MLRFCYRNGNTGRLPIVAFYNGVPKRVWNVTRQRNRGVAEAEVSVPVVVHRHHPRVAKDRAL